MLETSTRLLELLSLLQVRREWTGPDLADRLEALDRVPFLVSLERAVPPACFIQVVWQGQRAKVLHEKGTRPAGQSLEQAIAIDSEFVAAYRAAATAAMDCSAQLVGRPVGSR